MNDVLGSNRFFIRLRTMKINYDVMYQKITSKTCQTGDNDHDGQKIKIEHDIVDKPVKPVNNLLVRLK